MARFEIDQSVRIRALEAEVSRLQTEMLSLAVKFEREPETYGDAGGVVRGVISRDWKVS